MYVGPIDTETVHRFGLASLCRSVLVGSFEFCAQNLASKNTRGRFRVVSTGHCACVCVCLCVKKCDPEGMFHHGITPISSFLVVRRLREILWKSEMRLENNKRCYSPLKNVVSVS